MLSDGPSSFRVERDIHNAHRAVFKPGESMSVGVEALFTSARGLQLPWAFEDMKLDTAKRRIDFETGCQGTALTCPACGAGAQPVHDRLRRSWRHLDFFRFEVLAPV